MNDDVVSEARHNVSCPVGGRGPPCPHGTSCLFVSRKTLHVLSHQSRSGSFAKPCPVLVIVLSSACALMEQMPVPDSAMASGIVIRLAYETFKLLYKGQPIITDTMRTEAGAAG